MDNKDLERFIKESKKVALINEEKSHLREEMVLFIKNHPERKVLPNRHYYWRSILALSLASILLFVVNLKVFDKRTEPGQIISELDNKVSEIRIGLEESADKVDLAARELIEEKLQLAEEAIATAKGKLNTSSSSEVMILIQQAERATEGASAQINQLDKKIKKDK